MCDLYNSEGNSAAADYSPAPKELEYSVVDFIIGKSPNHDQEQLEIYRKWFDNQSVKDVMWNTYWKMDRQSRLI